MSPAAADEGDTSGVVRADDAAEEEAEDWPSRAEEEEEAEDGESAFRSVPVSTRRPPGERVLTDAAAEAASWIGGGSMCGAWQPPAAGRGGARGPQVARQVGYRNGKSQSG